MQVASEVNEQTLGELIAELLPDVETVQVSRLGTDDETGSGEETEKGFGYGEPLLITARTASGRCHEYVLHTAGADQFGHDRRSDRAQAMILASDTYGRIPRHVSAVDVGAIVRGGRFQSLRDSQEFYLLTEYAPGALYADDLRRMAHQRVATERDGRRCELLADYLAELHEQRIDDGIGDRVVYRRSIRDLVGHGEGIFGIIDGYPDEVPGASRERLRAIEELCCEWRWRLRDHEYRLTRTHGDFHPFNILFDERDELALLDASRGCLGDAADDVCCLAINYVFFAIGEPGAWQGGLGHLWRRFWDRYLTRSGDEEVLEVAPPWIAWRGLVLANPTWYPAMSAEHRDILLGLVEDVLAAECFDPACAEALFR
jgi:aminoglycoside phosphotransferase (APT) family kinase protein